MAAIPLQERMPAATAQAADAGVAIARVLEAERAARAATQNAEGQAAALLQAAREAARRIGARAARRSAYVHDWAEAQIAARLAALDADRALLTALHPDAAADAAHVRAATQRLTAALLAAGEESR